MKSSRDKMKCVPHLKERDGQTDAPEIPLYPNFPDFYVLKTSCLPHFIGFGGRGGKVIRPSLFNQFPFSFSLAANQHSNILKLPMATQSERLLSPYQCGETGVVGGRIRKFKAIEACGEPIESGMERASTAAPPSAVNLQKTLLLLTPECGMAC